jgi:hypothetical protein
VQVNHRFFGPLDPEGFDRLADELRSGRLADTVPAHGTLSRVERNVGLPALVAKSSAAAPAAGGQVQGTAPGPITGPVPA